MASEIKTNKLDTYNASKVELVTKLDIVSGGSIDTQSGAGAVDFGNASSVAFANNAIDGGAIGTGSAECSLASGTAVKLAPTSTGVVVTGTITGATTINATTDVQLNGVGLRMFDPWAWGRFTCNITISAAGAVTLNTLGEAVTGSSEGFNTGHASSGAGVPASNKIQIYYNTVNTTGAEAMVQLQIYGDPGLSKVLDYTFETHDDRVIVVFPVQVDALDSTSSTAIEASILVFCKSN
jgi:hypothetical protein